MKKRAQNLLTLILVLSLCLSCMLMPHAADAAASVTVHSQSELTNAFSTLAASGGTITLGADITLDGAVSLPAVTKAVTLNGDGHTLTLSGDLALNGDAELQNITICNDGDSRLISCGGHTVRFDATVSCTATDLFYPTIAGGNADSTAYSGGELTIGGGTWQRVLSGNAGTGASAQSGKVSITGGSFEEAVQVGGAGQMASGSKITMHITDGSFKDGIVFFSTKETATANLSLLLSGGNFAGKIRVSDEAGTLNGSCNLRMVGGEFSNCTGIEGWTGNGNLKANLNVSHALSESMFTLYADDTLDTTLLRTGVADPCLVYVNGFYYLTMTGSKNIALLKADRLSKLSQLTLGSNIAYRSASDATAVQTFGYNDLSGTWSPELHYFSEDDFPGQSGWYMYLALRNNSGDSSEIRMVTLRSANSNAPESPFVNPKTQVINNSQPILDKDGEIIAEWGCGMSILRIEEGEYKGIYAMWVAEENRGTIDFAQKIMIAKMKSPWELASEPTAILHPTQRWEKFGSGKSGSKYYPAVVEGATALYGKDGQVYVIYCGSGYWTKYGLGQITWNGGDPQDINSWVKYEDNPVFGANDKDGKHYLGVYMQGAGHAFFVKDAKQNLFAVYHAYPTQGASGAGKAKARNAYIEPCMIDYTVSNGVNMGVLTFTNGKKPAPVDTEVSFTIESSQFAFTDLIGEDGLNTAYFSYNAAYDYNGDGSCNIVDVLILLRNMLFGKGGTLSDVMDLLRFITG